MHSRLNKPSQLRTVKWIITKMVFPIAVLYLSLAPAPLAALLNLTSIGDGFCRDSSGNTYDHVLCYPVNDSSGHQLKGDAMFGAGNSWCSQNTD